MKNLILLSMIVLTFASCNSQKAEVQPILKIENSSLKNMDENYFLGSWSVSKIFYIKGATRELQLNDGCAQKSFWKFTKENAVLKQSKVRRAGSNCERSISTSFGIVTLDQNQMTYFVDDVVYSVQISVISDHEFILKRRDLIAGQLVEVEEVYIKLK